MRTQPLTRILLAVVCTTGFPIQAQPLSNVPRQDFWVTDGTVSAIAVTNNRVFIGGDFTYVGPWTGGGVPVDLNTMLPVEKYPRVNGSVHAVEADGQGGWFIGGDFTTVGGRPRTNLAHITAAGEVDTNWTAHATSSDGYGRVTKLALDGMTLYAAGEFTHLGGLPRHYVGALESTDGAVTAWSPQINSNVLALAVAPKAVYLGGKFRYVGESNRNYLAAIDKASGEATAWDPNADRFPHGFVLGGFMTAITPHGNLVYVGGQFNNFFDLHLLVAIDEKSGLRTWGAGRAFVVNALKVHDDKLYVGGLFNEIGGDGGDGHVPRDRLAALDPITGAVLPWSPSIGDTVVGDVMTMAFEGDQIIVGGRFLSPNPPADAGVQTNADYVASFSLTDAEEPGPRRPWNNGLIYALAVQGGRSTSAETSTVWPETNRDISPNWIFVMAPRPPGLRT